MLSQLWKEMGERTQQMQDEGNGKNMCAEATKMLSELPAAELDGHERLAQPAAASRCTNNACQVRGHLNRLMASPIHPFGTFLISWAERRLFCTQVGN